MRRKSIAVELAVALVPDGASVMVGGFMGGGSPHRLIDELVRQGKAGLTLICNDSGRPGFGVGRLIDAGLVSCRRRHGDQRHLPAVHRPRPKQYRCVAVLPQHHYGKVLKITLREQLTTGDRTC